MAAEKLKYTDTLRKGTDKINAAIDQSDEAIKRANNAEGTANDAKNTAKQALSNSESTQDQLDNIIIESGTSDAETIQARTNERGVTFDILKDRIDSLDIDLEERGVNVKWFGASGSNQQTTGTITAGSNELTVTDPIDFKVGQGIAITGAGEGGVAEEASLQITSDVTTDGEVTITLDGIATNVPVVAGDTAVQVADKIRETSFDGWTTGGTQGTDIVTFTCNTPGEKQDATYADNGTGSIGIMTIVTQGSNGNDLITKIIEINGGSITLETNASTDVSSTPVYHDDTEAIKEAINIIQVNGGIVYIPIGRYIVSSTLVIPKGVELKGAGKEPWQISGAKGTVIASSCPAGIPTIMLGDIDDDPRRGVSLRSMKILGNYECDGVKTEENTYNVTIENVISQRCRRGFDLDSTWNVTAISMIAQQCETGFYFQGIGGTSSLFQSCLAYNSTHGFYFDNAWTYSTFAACGADGCGTGLYIGPEAAHRGLSFVNFGVERATVHCIHIAGHISGVYTFHCPTIGDHGDKEIELIKIEQCETTTFYDMRVSSAQAPIENGKVLSISPDAENKVMLINCSLFANQGDTDKCTVIGGPISNRIQHDIEIKNIKSGSIVSHSGTTNDLAPDATTPPLFTLGGGQTYLCVAMTATGGTQQCQQFINVDGPNLNKTVSDITDKEFVEFFVDGDDVKIRNLSSSNKSYIWSALRIR